MSDQYKRALRACYDGMLKMRQDEHGHQLFCYTQDCFFGKDTWNELTKTHRGALYYQANQVNMPFSKIFNLNEQPECELDVVLDRMANEDYTVLDKANGHLFIISCFTEDMAVDKNIFPAMSPVEPEQHVVFHTKGGLPGPDNDLLNDDIRIFWSKFGEKMDTVVEMFPNSTWMFESIVAHDKHTMYKQQVELYGGDENTFVLLGANVHNEHGWHEMSYNDLDLISQYIGCPLVVSYDSLEGTPDQWLEHKDREGYVIHFTGTGAGDRVKIKTRDYWAMRFKKDLTPERILAMYRKTGGTKLRLSLPEEVADEIIEVLKGYHEIWFLDRHIEIEFDTVIHDYILTVTTKELTREARADLFKDDRLTMPQKQYIAARADGKNPVKTIGESRTLRDEFVDYILHNKLFYENFEYELEQLVDSIGET